MRLTLSVPVFVLAAAAAADGDKCAVCPETLLPGPDEIAWHLVFNRTVADNVMFCGFQGKGRNKPKPAPRPAQTFCIYTVNTGKIIPKDQSLEACPKTAELAKCLD